MPELPEVEVTRRGLAPLLAGRRITGVRLSGKPLRYPLDPALASLLTGRRIEEVGRRAKYLLFRVDGDMVLVWHLGMSGRFHLVSAAARPLPHCHVVIELDGGDELRYVDPRRFGYGALVAVAALARHPWFCTLGPEPLAAEFSAAWLHTACRGRRTPIKPLLMDNRVVVGIGNIYASEALFIAGIHPARRAAAISESRLASLVAAIREVLAAAIDAGGSTIRDFARVDGRPGYFAYHFSVYGREGEACRRCGRSIRRTVQAGRSTFYCPGCQR